MTQCYIIEHTYVGPNQDQDNYVDADYIEISSVPARTNMSNEERIEGWCGTTNDWCVTAHGEFSTIEEAEAEIAEKFGEVRDCDPNGDPFCHWRYEDTVLKIYKRSKYEPMSRQATADWAWAGIKEDIEADTTDERIDELVDEYEETANSEGYTLADNLEDCMKERRQNLQKELAEAD